MTISPDEPVRTLMSDPVVSVTRETTMQAARELFFEHGVHHLPVVDDAQHLIGIISHTDLFRLGVDDAFPDGPPAQDAAASDATVASFMRDEPLTVGPEDPIRLAAAMMATGIFHALPVVDGDRLVGIVTASDLLQILADA